MASAKATIDHDQIRKWVETRGGHPAHVKRTGTRRGNPGVLRIDYPGFSGEESLERIDWDQWFDWFDRDKLAFLYQDEKKSRFSKLVDRSTVEVAAAPARKSAATKKRAAAPKSNGNGSAKKTASRKTTAAKSASTAKTTSAKSASTAKRATAAKKTATTSTESAAKRTTSHSVIQKWVEARGGYPARVKKTGRGKDPGILRIDYPGYSGGDTLERIDWDEWFDWFDRDKLAFLYQNKRDSRFSKLVRR